MPSYRPHATNVGHAMRCRRSHMSCVVRACSCSRSPRRCSVDFLPRAPRGHHLDEAAIARMAGEPVRVEARVEQSDAAGRALGFRQRRDLLQRVGRAAPAAGRRAGEHEPLDAIGHGHRELVTDDAAEAHAEHPASIPAEMVDQRDHVRRVVGHGVRTGGDRRAAEPADRARRHRSVRRTAGSGARWSPTSSPSR